MCHEGLDFYGGIMELTTKPHRAVATLLLAFALVAASCSSSSDDVDTAPSTATAAPVTATAPPTTAPPTTAPPTTAPATSAAPEPESTEPLFELTGQLDLTTEEINDMVLYVEETMGRPFLTPPKIVLQSIEDFEAGLQPSERMRAFQQESAEGTGRFLQAVGQTELSPDELLGNLTELGSSTDLISGRYLPDDDTVYIPEGALSGGTFNAILVHELAHALDGQYVDMQGMIEQLEDQATADVSGDESFSVRAVIEGRATAVQIRWMMANNVVPEIPETPASYAAVPPSVILGVQLPYQLGAQTVEGLGGPAATWDLFDAFPTSSEQMMFAPKIGTDLPVEVAPPAVQGELFNEGVFGAESLLLLLIGDSLAPSQVDVVTSLNAVDGIAGGYYVLDGDDTRSCFRANIAGDDADELAEIEARLLEWAAKDSVPGAERTVAVDGDILQLTACAPFIS